jgi:hypothetical protein
MHRLIFATVIALALATRANAHALDFDCKVKRDRVELEAYYDDDTPARSAKVRVEDQGRQLIAEGRTDEEGRWSFARPESGPYRVIVDAGAGHRSEREITITAEAATTEPAAPKQRTRRERFTEFPWLRLGGGLAIIAGLGAAAWVGRKIGRHARRPYSTG